MTRLRPIQPSLPFAGPDQPKPRQVTTNSGAEFFALVAQAAAGRLVIEAVAQGKGPGQWVCEVRYLR